MGVIGKLSGQSTTPWVTKSFDEPDLSHASHYYRTHMTKIDPYYRPHPAMVQCGSIEKPAVFVKIPDMSLQAFGRVIIGEFRTQALELKTYAVLWIRAVAHDPEGEPIRAMIPGQITIATRDADLSIVPFDLFLDVADLEVVRWVTAWSKWPNVVFFYVLEGKDRIAAYLNFFWPPGATETIINSLQETQKFLAEIPSVKREFETAVQQLRATLKSL
jgi:hypothetical protein